MKREAIKKIFSNIPTLKTERLILRKITVKDVDDVYEYSSDPDTSKYLLWSPHPDRYYTIEYVTYLKTRYRSGDFFDWGIIDRETNKMIGTCGFTRFEYNHNSAEVGFVLNKKYHGKGIATEAAREVLKFGFENLALNRIECKYIVGNNASRRVMDKLSMTFEGIVREGMLVKGTYRDIGVCSLLRKEYEEQNNYNKAK